MFKIVNAGEIYTCDFGNNYGSVQSGVRPCVVIDNTNACAFSPCIHCVPLTTQNKNDLPVHYILHKDDYYFLKSDSIVLTEQLTIQSTDNVIKFLGRLNNCDITQIKECIKLQFNL